MIVSLLLTALLAGAPDAPATQTAKPPKEDKICRREVATGSIAPTRVCRTAAEWQAVERQQEDAGRDYKSNHSDGR